MNLSERTKLLLQEYQIRPNKLLGQNFMVEPSIFQSLSNYASLRENDVALDVGAGFGFLTRYLSSKCKKVLAVEADDRIANALNEQLKDLSNVTIIRGRMFDTRIPEFDKVISAPPYQISSRLVLWLLNRHFNRAAMIFQKEFANRLAASVGTEDYSWLTVLTYHQTECELLEDVPRDMFYPRPEVSSIIVRLAPRQKPAFVLKNKKWFATMLQSLFAQRNRKVRNAILPFLKGVLMRDREDASAVARALPFCDRRVRELAPEDFGALANAL